MKFRDGLARGWGDAEPGRGARTDARQQRSTSHSSSSDAASSGSSSCQHAAWRAVMNNGMRRCDGSAGAPSAPAGLRRRHIRNAGDAHRDQRGRREHADELVDRRRTARPRARPGRSRSPDRWDGDRRIASRESSSPVSRVVGDRHALRAILGQRGGHPVRRWRAEQRGAWRQHNGGKGQRFAARRARRCHPAVPGPAGAAWPRACMGVVIVAGHDRWACRRAASWPPVFHCGAPFTHPISRAHRAERVAPDIGPGQAGQQQHQREAC